MLTYLQSKKLNILTDCSTKTVSSSHVIEDHLENLSPSFTKEKDSMCRSSFPKLDRSISEPYGGSQSSLLPWKKSVNPVRYKTELCRQYEENGFCRYGEKCQFAHGEHEMRSLDRHPKFKTEMCRTFHTTGFCPYGHRCHFIHEDERISASMVSSSVTGTPNVSYRGHDFSRSISAFYGSISSTSGSLHNSGSSSPIASPSIQIDNAVFVPPVASVSDFHHFSIDEGKTKGRPILSRSTSLACQDTPALFDLFGSKPYFNNILGDGNVK